MMTKSIWLWLVGAAMVGMGMVGASRVAAQEIAVSPPLTVATQTEFTVSITIDAASDDVYGLEVTMSYDPAIVQLDGIDAGDWFVSSGLPYFFHDFTDDVAPGVLFFDAAFLGDGRSGTGDVAICHFTALAAGDSPLDFVQVVARDGANQDLAFGHSTGDLITVPSSQLYFDPSVSVPVTMVFTVDLRIDAVGSQVKGAEVAVDFDPAIVALDAVTPGDWVTTQGLLYYFYDYTTGGTSSIHFAMSFLDGVATDGGVLAVCHFTAIDVGTSPLDFVDVDVRDIDNQTLPFLHSTGDQIVIEQAVATEPTTFGAIKSLFR